MVVPVAMVHHHEVCPGIGFDQITGQDAAVADLRLSIPIAVGGIDLKHL